VCAVLDIVSPVESGTMNLFRLKRKLTIRVLETWLPYLGREWQSYVV